MKTLLTFTFFIMLLLSACKDNSTSADNNSPGANEVVMQGSKFSPAQITVAKGTTVKWINRDSFAHTVTSSSQPQLFDSGNMGANQTFTFKFDSAGTYSYYCKIHTGMTGSVVVQ